MATKALKVLGVLAGEDMPLTILRRWADTADVVMAADSGADRLLACRSRIDVLVGDLDSVTDQGRRSAKEVVHSEEQETTDCDKLLACAAQRGYSSITLISVEGSQPDHVLATHHSAARSPLNVRLAYRRGVGRIVKSGARLHVPALVGERFSLLPLLPCEGVNMTGVQWPLTEASLSPDGRSSVSNVAVSDGVWVELRSGLAMLYSEQGDEPRWD